MIFQNGLPRDNGATDCMDSSRLAGMMVIAKHPQAPDCSQYFINGQPVRFPFPDPANANSNNPRMFSRDQMICLAAGLMLQGHKDLIASMHKNALKSLCRAPNNLNDDGSKKWFGGDFILPHIMGALKVAAGLKPKLNIFERLLLRIDLWQNNRFSPLREPNQLMAVCVMAGPEAIQLLKKSNPQWQQAVNEYWALSYRNESELAQMLKSNF
jgi:hypothetical protein